MDANTLRYGVTIVILLGTLVVVVLALVRVFRRDRGDR